MELPQRSDKDVDITATEMTRQFVEDKVAVACFERKGEVAQQALEEVVEAAAHGAAQVVLH
jgi:hypothetical protein